MDEPCSSWPLDPNCLPDGWPADHSEMSPDQQAAHDAASELLWRLTAGRYGECSELVRPCRMDCATPPPAYDRYPPAGGPAFTPTVWAGRWVNIVCGCVGPCGCGGQVFEVSLPGPIIQVDAVKVDGELLSAAAYRVDDGKRLIRVDGEPWPACQRLDLADSEQGTWSVAYSRGRAVPAGGRRAAAALTVEIWKACSGDKSCRLPQRVQQIVREGVTMTLLDPLEYLDKARTGLVDVDLWLAAVNPHGQRSPSSVWSPDMQRMRRPGAGW
jgi:hypothetical protein